MSIFDYVIDIFMRPKLYTKFWIALLSAVLTALSIQFSDNVWLQSFIPFLGSMGIIAAPNKK